MLKQEDFADPDAGKKPKRGGPKVRKPTSKDDIRVHSTWRWKNVRVVEHKTKFFLVAGPAANKLKDQVLTVDLVAAITVVKDKLVPFVWPADAQTDGTEDAIKGAIAGWVKVSWDGTNRSYTFAEAKVKRDDPKWAFDSFEQLVEMAFHGRIIEKEDDPIIDEILCETKQEAE
jgi:hypothetical protein